MNAVFDGGRKLNLGIESAAEGRDCRVAYTPLSVAQRRCIGATRRDVRDNENRFINARKQRVCLASTSRPRFDGRQRLTHEMLPLLLLLLLRGARPL